MYIVFEYGLVNLALLLTWFPLISEQDDAQQSPVTKQRSIPTPLTCQACEQRNGCRNLSSGKLVLLALSFQLLNFKGVT